MRTLSRVMSGVVTLGMTGGLLLGATGVANAAYNPSTPPYPVDPNNVASLTIFDATTGAVVRSGATNVSLDHYYFASSTDFSPGHTKALVYGYLAEAGKDPGAFSGTPMGAGSTYPDPAAPAPVNSIKTPTAKGGTTSSFAALAGAYPNTAPSTSDFYQLYQIRVKTTFPTPASTTYAFMDIAIDPATATWKQLNPTGPTAPVPPDAPGKPTATAGDTTASVNVPAVAGATSYTVTSSPGGLTQTGAGPTFSFTGLTNGTPYTFTSTATNANGTSAASPASDPVTPAHVSPASSTALGVTGGPYANQPYTFTATVSSAGSPSQVNAGSVSFFDNGSTTPLGTVSGTSGGSYVLSGQSLPAGSHSVVAVFTPTAGADIAGSRSAASAFGTQAPLAGACTTPGSVCTDPQNIQVDVPVGALIINTPYTPAAPLVLPAMTLNQAGNQLSSNKAFANIVVTDTRSGDLPWTATALSSNLNDGQNNPNSTINAQNVGLTGLVATTSANYLGKVTTTDNAAADPAVAPLAGGSQGLGGTLDHTFATTTIGRGTTTMNGTMTINAPTSTEAGTFKGTVTFTVG